MIGVVFPSHFEASEFVVRLKNKAPAKLERHLPTWRGNINDREIAVGVVGMGPPHCALRTEKFLDFYPVKTLMLAGFAGALDPTLKRGEVIINRGEGKIATADDVIATASDKARLLAESGAPLVDMESAHVEAVAQKHQTPLIVVRAVSDTASEDVPVDILSRSYDQEQGVTTPVKLGLYLAWHWGDLGRLMRFLKPLSGVRRGLTSVLVSEITKLPNEEN
ncbi:hypothetical protein [Cerasicoccus maritimus]|uniref:phosphorylase family protein n=1 Tax=Cerasicoccus maritimus TaxID=490089 RepID=UPI002852BECF|nr:hypothetical protein [Cerasicoccus maritimus]